MGLLTDGIIASLNALRAYDSSVLDVASTEDIDVTAKLALAQKQIEVELGALLGSSDLSNVVVTEALRQWHMLQSLSLVYLDAYHRQLNDRYSGKWLLYGELAKRAAEALFRIGIGTVDNPIGCAEPPELTPAAGPLPATTYYVQVSWTNGEGQEGSPSEPSVLSAPDGHTLVVRPVNPPAGVTGWNVYAGLSADEAALQNTTPLALAEAWTEPASGLCVGRRPGTGQGPSRYLTLSRILQRG